MALAFSPGARVAQSWESEAPVSLPDEITQFIEGNIDSIIQLETLRIVASDRGKEWAAADLARDVQTDLESMVSHLEILEARGLPSALRQGGLVVSCRYGARSPALENILTRVLLFYRHYPVTMIRAIYGR
jgi:hypothetical protein